MRPGRKPSDPRWIHCKLRFDTVETAERVRAAGGGPWVKALILAELGLAPPPITTELEHQAEKVELRVSIPRSRL
jgi:hypothetical protein